MRESTFTKAMIPSPQRSLRIVIITPSYLPVIGGLERVMELLAKEWASQGQQVRVFNGDKLVDLDGEPIVDREGRGISQSARWADVIIAANAPLRQLISVSGNWRKVVLQHHSMYSYHGRHALSQRLKDRVRTLAIISRPNIAVSQAVAEVLPSRAEVQNVPNPVDQPPMVNQGWGRRQYDFLFVGRFVPDKGLDLYLDALASLGGEWRAAVAGVGPEARLLEAGRSGKLMTEGRLHVLGALPPAEVLQRMSDARWLVIPSRSEPFGLVAVEALAQGCGLVVSGVGGLSRYVDWCGLGFRTESAADLAARLAQALGMPQFPDAWREARTEILSDHDVKKVASEYLAIFNGLARAE